MSSYGRSKRVKREKWANRMAVLGVTMVVLCLAVAVNAKGSTLKKSDLDYQQKEKQLEEQVREEEERTKKLEEYKVYRRRHGEKRRELCRRSCKGETGSGKSG